MSSITTWQRLEPIPRTNDLRKGLRAEIADPLWMLARQRQFGELLGEDAGSPVEATLNATSGRISRVHLGRTGTAAETAAAAFDHRDTDGPLEALVEREPLRGQPDDGGLVVSAGLHFLRLLRHRRVTTVITKYLARYPLADIDLPGDDPDTTQLRRRATTRVPNARALAADLLAHRGTATELTTLPATPSIPPADRAKVLSAANAFLAAWTAALSEPPDPTTAAWDPTRLEHTFSVQATLPAGPVVLTAEEYRGGRIDWPTFVASATPTLGDPAAPVAPTPLTRTVLPTPVTYGGMPAQRFWEIEDGTVRFGSLDTGRTDLARMLLAEFALTYGNDWFVIPVDLPVGSVTTIDSFNVVDTFGVPTSVGRSVTSAARGFRMFEVDAPKGPRRVENLYFLAPAVAEVTESPPTEHVVFFRDEMANIVWGVERIYQGGAGTPVDRFEEHQQAIGERQQIRVDFGDAQLLYRLQTDIPDHWNPFVPVRAGATAPAGVIQLERRPMIRIIPREPQPGDPPRQPGDPPPTSTLTINPKGRILNARSPLRLEEEEVPRDGTEVVRTYQLTRWPNGRYTLWSGRNRTTGAGEGRSNFRTDIVIAVTTFGT